MENSKPEERSRVAPQDTANPEKEHIISLSGRRTIDGFEATGKVVMAAEATAPKPRELKDVLEIAGKIMIGFAGLSYVLGLFVVSIHLRRYNLNSLSLSQLHYVTAGVWALVPIIISVLLVAFAFTGIVVDRKDRAGKWSRLSGIFSGIFVAVILFSFVAGRFSSYFGVKLSWVNWVFIPLLGIVALGFVGVALFAVSEAGRKRSFWTVVGAILTTVLAALLSLAYLVLFATHTYEDIPWSTGGGHSSQVQLVVTSEARQYLESAGIKFVDAQNRTESVQLLLGTEKEYVVIDPAGNAVGIPTDSVKAVLYAK